METSRRPLRCLDDDDDGGTRNGQKHAAAADLSRFLRERLLSHVLCGDTEAALAALPSRFAAPGLAARLLVERGRSRMGEGEGEKSLDRIGADALEALRLVSGHRGALRLLGEAAAAAAAAAESSGDSSDAADRAFLAFRELRLSGVDAEVEVEEVAAAAAARACRDAQGRRNGEPSSASSPRRRRYYSPSPPPGLDERGRVSASSREEISAALEELRLPPSRTLEIPPAAAVRAAFLSRAARCHPDKKGKSESGGGGDGEEFVRAHRAYRLLMGVASEG